MLQTLVGDSWIHRQKAGKALSIQTCTSVFERRGKMRAQPGSAEDADRRRGFAASALVGDMGKSCTPRAMKIFRYQRAPMESGPP